MKKHCLVFFSLFQAVCLYGSVFNEVLSARLDGEEPPAWSFVNDYQFIELNEGSISPNLISLFDSELDYLDRVEVAKAINYNSLSAEDKQGLYSWLSNTQPVDKNSFSELSELSLRNDLLVHIINTSADREYLGKLMLYVVHDQSQSLIWREYVLQHFVTFYEKTWIGADGDYLSSLRDAFQYILADCLFEDNALCGTSMINLVYLCETCPEFKERLVTRAARNIARDVNSLPESRISSLQVLGEQGAVKDTRIAVKILGETPSPSAGVQRAALGVLKLQNEWHPRVSRKLEKYIESSTHGRLRRLARTLLEN